MAGPPLVRGRRGVRRRGRKLVAVALAGAMLGAVGCKANVEAQLPPSYEPFLTHETVGESVQGRAIQLTSIGRGEEAVLIMGAFHGDEWQSAYVAERLATYLAATGRVPPARKALVVPEVNPDGVAARTRGNVNGVDINRNFPTGNWRPAAGRSPRRHGPKPASEPETRTVMALLERHRPVVIVSIHTMRRGRFCVNYDGPAQALARAMADRCRYPVKHHIGYETPGSFGTYAGIEGRIPTITLELPRAKTGEACWQDVRTALLAALAFGADGGPSVGARPAGPAGADPTLPRRNTFLGTARGPNKDALRR